MNWIIHLDTDELVHPAGTREYSARELFSHVPENVDMVVFPNYVSESRSGFITIYSLHLIVYSRIDYEFICFIQESSVERDDIKDPFSEVRLHIYFYQYQ